LGKGTVSSQGQSSIKQSSIALAQGRGWEIQFSEIALEQELGKGSSGIVYLAKWRNQRVAVKKVMSDLTPDQLKAFTAECEVMSCLRPHKNVVQLLGMCTNPLCLITEYYPNGSLLNYLLCLEKPMSNQQVLKILKGIAAGMVHLHRESTIHRDLAGRNILLTETLEPAVADFGLARTVSEPESSAMTKTNVGPIKWMAPESLQDHVYSTKTDVWAFGVTAWEIITKGATPYEDLEAVGAGFAVMQGLRLKFPAYCPAVLSALLVKCWESDPAKRPSMQEIFEGLETMGKNI